MFGFPLLLIPLAIFNIVMFLMPGVDFSAPAFAVALMSGATWTVSFGDILIVAALVLLLCEIVKVGRAGGRYLTDHLLSLLVLAAAVAEFVWLAPFATFPFFMLCALAFIDVVAGIALHRRRARTPAPAPAVAPAPPAPPPPPPAAAPRVEPVVMPPVPPAPSDLAASPPPPAAAAPDGGPSLGDLVPGVAPTPAEGAPAPADRNAPGEKS